MQLWNQTIQRSEQSKVLGMSAGGLPRPPFAVEDSGSACPTNWLRTIQIDNASNGISSSSNGGGIGGQAAGMSALLPFVRQYAFSNPNFGSSPPAGGSNSASAPGATTTTTRHFAAWEQTTTHFQSPNSTQPQQQPLGQHTHPALLASVNLKASPVIRPIPSRSLNTASPGPKPELLGPPLKPPPVKLGE